MRGKVQSMDSLGAFITLGDGTSHMLHTSEMSHEHVEHAEKLFSVGEELKVGLCDPLLANDWWT